MRTEIRLKNWFPAFRLSSSLKVIDDDTDQSGNDDLLLVIYGNCGPISYRFLDKRQFQPKN